MLLSRCDARDLTLPATEGLDARIFSSFQVVTGYPTSGVEMLVSTVALPGIVNMVVGVDFDDSANFESTLRQVVDRESETLVDHDSSVVSISTELEWYPQLWK